MSQIVRVTRLRVPGYRYRSELSQFAMRMTMRGCQSSRAQRFALKAALCIRGFVSIACIEPPVGSLKWELKNIHAHAAWAQRRIKGVFLLMCGTLPPARTIEDILRLPVRLSSISRTFW